MTTATRTRDSQRARVYTAETYVRRLLDNSYEMPTVRLYGSNVVLPQERRWGTVEAMQEYVSSLAPGVRVRTRQGATKAHYEDSTQTIAIPDTRNQWAMRELVACHEIAHHRARGDQHGPKFVTAFIELVTEQMGPEAGFLLRAMLYENGAVAG